MEHRINWLLGRVLPLGRSLPCGSNLPRNKPFNVFHAQAVRLLRGLTAWLNQNRHAPSGLSAAALEQNRTALHETIILVSKDRAAEYGRSADYCRGMRCQLAETLAQEGYEVCNVGELPAALESLQQEHPSLLIFCGSAAPGDWIALRQMTAVPILALLSQPTKAEVLEAFEAGVDDCQMISISTPEIILRMRALLRRNHPESVTRNVISNKNVIFS